LPFFRYSSSQPLADEAKYPSISDAMLDELKEPIVSNFIEKAPDVGVKNPIHFPPHDSHPERIQRIMLASPRSEPIREPQKVLFVNLIEDRHHCVLDDLILQRSDP
jgi:hypothetical protein